MNCHEVKELSSAYLDQKLAPSQISSFEKHLNVCASCREEVEGLRKRNPHFAVSPLRGPGSNT